MPAEVRVVHMFAKVNEGLVVNTCSNASTGWERDLSPFIVGPCKLYDGLVALNAENAWQYSKVYKQHLGDSGDPPDPGPAWFEWSRAGFANPRANRYPMGKGARPEYSFWDGKKLTYVKARKVIYGPLYAEAVQKTAGFKHLVELYHSEKLLVLRDWDGRNTKETLTEVLKNPYKKMGHAFVLKMLLTGDSALDHMELRKEGGEVKTIYQQMVEAGAEIDNHKSDLYVKSTPKTREIIRGYEYLNSVTTFTSQIDGQLWMDIPFAFDPFWEEVRTRSMSTYPRSPKMRRVGTSERYRGNGGQGILTAKEMATWRELVELEKSSKECVVISWVIRCPRRGLVGMAVNWSNDEDQLEAAHAFATKQKDWLYHEIAVSTKTLTWHREQVLEAYKKGL